MKITIEFYIFELVSVLANNLHFLEQITPQKRHFQSKIEKNMNVIIEFFIVELV